MNEFQEAVTTTDQPSGVVTFEEATKRFDEEAHPPKSFSGPPLRLLLVSLAAIIFFICCGIIGDILPPHITTLGLIGGSLLFLQWYSLSSVSRVADTPYGNIVRLMWYRKQSQSEESSYIFIYPALSPKTGRVRRQSVTYEELDLRNKEAYVFYEQKIKENPVSWLQYMFYRTQVEKLENITQSFPVPPTAEQECLDWYKGQRDHFYNLFINTQEESK